MAVKSGDIEVRLGELAAACRKAGAKLTHQRMEIFREVSRSKEHPDAEDVFMRVRRRIPAISLNTVYRTLWFLEKHKLISRVDGLCDSARYDGNTGKHHHFVCSECGAIRDFESPELDRLGIHRRLEEFGEVNSCRLQAQGICRKCLGRESHRG